MLLDVSHITVAYGKSLVIQDLSFSVAAGSRTAILGRNGVGKTTLLKSIMGILPLSAGQMSYQDQPLAKLKTYQRSLAGIGYVPQGRDIIPQLTVGENLELGALTRRNIPVRAKKDWALGYFPMLRDHLNRAGGVLSGGLQQQLALARCLICEPRIILLDEPTEGIQPNIVADLALTLKKIAAETGITILLVEQNLKFARRVADDFLIMQKGAIAVTGPMADLDDRIIQQYLSV
ncbi:ATP-binding cassette domain-containing protein [Oscillospiraceae bacterium HV4-5-C5C]|nr:ATP-binding cassette domain-containing protein [Oscillospiraceae bacterium HV4-5-C5C]